MNACVEVQRGIDAGPDEVHIRRWVDSVLDAEQHSRVELTVRIVDEDESAALNEQYRHKQGPTNVLSFPMESPAEVTQELEMPLLGDLVICAPVVEREATQQGKQELAHWAHMVVHGTLHLLGFDHVQKEEAELMENRETGILQALGYADPYRSDEEQ